MILPAECFTADRAELVRALTTAPVLDRYRAWLDIDLATQAEADQQQLVRQHQAAIMLLGASDPMTSREPTVDALLTDILAVATWEGWPLPLRDQMAGEVDIGAFPHGLLGLVSAGEGAVLCDLGDDRWALVRARNVGEQADMQTHWRHAGGDNAN